MPRLLAPLSAALAMGVLAHPVAAQTSSRDSQGSRPARDAEAHAQAGRHGDAAKAYERAYLETKNPEYLRKAGHAYLALGAAGRKDARTAFQLYTINARNADERAEGERLLSELDALERPAPEAAPAPAPTPELAPPVAPPPMAPPPAAPPITPITAVGDAKWSPTLGFVQPEEAAPAKDEASAGGAVKVPGTVELGLSGAGFAMSVASLSLNPSNDGITDDETALTAIEVGFLVRAEFRTQASLIAPWFDVGGWFMIGEREETAPSSTGVIMSAMGLRARAQLGVDVHPASFIGAGPFVGYRMDAYDVDLERKGDVSNDPITDNSFATDSGLLYGVHLRLRTKETTTSPPVLFVDPALTWRNGKFVNGMFAGVESGFRSGDFTIGGFFERRLSTSGRFGAGDAADLSSAFANSMPVEQRLGLFIGGMWDGRS